MPLKFYLDAHIPKQIAVQLRNKGVDVVRCQGVGMDDSTDEEHLKYALKEVRALVSLDRDFTRLNAEYQSIFKARKLLVRL